MNILTSFIFGLIQSDHLQLDSATGFYESMPVYSTMYINGTDLQKEIKRTPRGLFIRDVDDQATIIHQKNFKGQTEVRVRSKNEWTMIDNPQDLSVWFEQMDLVNGDRSRCKFQGNAYVIWMNGHYIMIADDTCEWSGAQTLAHIIDRPIDGADSRYFADVGE